MAEFIESGAGVGGLTLSDNVGLGRHLEESQTTSIESRPDLGRVVVAKRDVPPGFKVIRERPVMVWRSDDWPDFFTQYKSLAEDDQRGILDMYHPPLSSPQMAMLLPVANVTAGRVLVASALVHKLIAICNTNAHEYYGCQSEAYREVHSIADRIGSGKTALFLYASKVAHSCNPNTTYSSRTSDGMLEYKAIRPIASGDMITFSYLEKLWETPTHMRRDKLLASKSFTCRCPRCMGPDYSRPLCCTKCKGAILCTDDGSGTASWTCQNCGLLPDMQAYEYKEREVEQVLDMWEQRMIVDLSLCIPDVFKKEIHRIASKLHPLHYLTLRAMALYVRLCASHANQLENFPSFLPPSMIQGIKRRFGDPSKLRGEAAQMGMSIVISIECIAASCCGHGEPGIGDIKKHMPVQDGAIIMFHVAQDLMACPHSWWPPNAAAMVHRYIPSMQIQFGDSDLDVAEIQQKIQPEEEKSVSVAKAPDKTRTKGSTKKKRGGSTKKKKGRKK